MKVYITFGQVHVHRVNGKTFDCDSVAAINCTDEAHGRTRAVEFFGDKWHQCLTTMSEQTLSYYPRGIIEVER